MANRGTWNHALNGGKDITTTAQQILSSNPNRRTTWLTNYGTETIWIIFGGIQEAVPGVGLALTPGKRYWIDDNNQYKGPVSAVTSTGVSRLCYTEGNR